MKNKRNDSQRKHPQKAEKEPGKKIKMLNYP
jgi:hypothetical protein